MSSSAHHVVIARQRFTVAFAGPDPRVVQVSLDTGVVREGTQWWSDDPIVERYPQQFVDASMLPEFSAAPATEPGQERPSGPEWVATVRAYRAVLDEYPGELPSQVDVAGKRHISEDTLHTRLQALGVQRWQDVHALVESEPEG